MSFQNKLSISLLLLAAALLYAVNIKAQTIEYDYNPVRLSENIVISANSKVNDTLLKIDVEDSENGSSVLAIDCHKRYFYFDLINGNGNEVYKPDVYPFREAQSTEILIIKFVCLNYG